MKTKNTDPETKSRRNIEWTILFLYTMHTVLMTLVAAMMDWGAAAMLAMPAGAVLCLYVEIRQVRTYEFRAFFVSAMLWLNTFLYGVFTDDFIGMHTTLCALLIMTALYGLLKVLWLGAGAYTLLLLFHLFIIRDVSPVTGESNAPTLLRILCIYLIVYVCHQKLLIQRENDERQNRIIESLHQAEQGKDDFLANVSHEIRTPVNTICGMSEIVLNEKLSPDVRTCVYGIQTAGRNLLSIVSDILDFSELESGNISIIEDSYSITSVINDIINMANARNSEKNLEIVVDCDPDMPQIMVGDRLRLCRAVMNIIDNAIKFTESGGVVLSMYTRKEEYGVNLCITVRDTGIGIKPENLEKIYSAFNQADSRRNRAEGGLGLGLMISRNILSKMGGFMNITSSYGEGTEVSMVVPQKVENGAPCISVKNAGSYSVLIYLHFDHFQHPLIRSGYRKSMERLLKRFGVPAFFCRNLPEVQRYCKREKITHLFISWEEYCEDRQFFEEASKEIRIVLVLDRKYQQELPESGLLCIYTPFYALSVASILNGEPVRNISYGIYHKPFTAPEAHVLIVDDNLMNLKVVEGLLRPYRMKISTAQSGREALLKITNKCYDFVFMDHMMPEMDGVETFHRIRQKEGAYYQKVPIVALTANVVGNARNMFLSEGFADYVAKPIEMTALEHVLRKFIPEKKIVYAGEEPADFGVITAEHTENPADGTAGKPENEEKAEKGQLTLKGIDVGAGIRYCGGSLHDYLDIIRIYYENGRENEGRLRTAFENRDLENYVILTHTLKSTSKSIGAEELSKLAAGLEEAGKKKNSAAITAGTEEMLTEYRRVLRTIGENQIIFPGGTDTASEENRAVTQEKTEDGKTEKKMTENSAETMTEAEFTDFCKRLSKQLESFEYDGAAELFEEIKGSCYRGGPAEEIFRPVRNFVEDFDFEGAQGALREIWEGTK